MALSHHWTPEQVDRMSDDDLIAVMRSNKPAAAPTYRDLFRKTWKARRRCVACGDVAKPKVWLCWCGGKLRPLTDAEVDEQWRRRQREEESRKARKRVRNG